MNIQQNISLAPYNTFGMDVEARYLIKAQSEQDIFDAIEFSKAEQLPIMVISGGSNMLLTEDLNAVVMLMDTRGIEILSDDGAKIKVKVAAGEDWPNFVEWTLSNNLCGIENLSLIPGRVGSSPVQNIGAYGVEAKDAIIQVNAVEIATLNHRSFSNAECYFGYRESVFKGELKGQYIITSVVFEFFYPENYILKLNYGNISTELAKEGITKPTIADVGRVVTRVRKEKLPDPKEIGNCGSFFKNPVLSSEIFEKLKEKHPEMPSFDVENPTEEHFKKVPAAWLIEKAGWKGFRRGDAGVHTNQALVLVNYGKAVPKEILDLCRDICEDVYKKFSVKISPEVNIIDNQPINPKK